MRACLFPATAPTAPKSASQAASRKFAGATSMIAIAVVLGLAPGVGAASRNRVTIDDSVLESLGPEPSVASLMLKPPRGGPAASRGLPGPAPRAIAEAPPAAPKSRLMLPGMSQTAPAIPTPQIAAAQPLRLPPMTSVAAAPAVRPAPFEAPRSRMVSAPSLIQPTLTPPTLTPPALVRPTLTPPAVEPTPQLALAPPALIPPSAPLLPTPPVAPLASGVRAAPTETPRSQLLLPPVMGERAPRPAAPSAPPPVAAAPSSWPSLAGAAVAAPLPPTVAFPPPPSAPPARQPVAAATPNARDILPPAPSAVPAVAPSAAPPSAAAKPAAIGARLLFQRGTLDPADGSREALSRLAAQLAAAPNRRVTIMSYALGASGETENSNDARRLSLDRALAVRSGLVQQGVRSTQVTVRALGNPGGEGPPDRVDILLLDE